MSISAIQGNETVENYFTNTSKRNTGELGKDDFLNLLVTQLRYQDPLKPMENTEFIAQMAQFSSLEQMSNMNTSFSSVKAFNMIGKQIIAEVKDEKTGEINWVGGIVESVKMSGSNTYVVVDEKDIHIDDITDVFEAAKPPKTSNITDFTGVIGKDINTIFIDAKTMENINIAGRVDSLEYKGGTVYTVLNGANVAIDDVVLNDDEKLNFVGLEDYLRQKIESGEEITVVLIEKNMNEEKYSKVTVKGKIKEINIDAENNEINAVMDGLRIPGNNITSIR